MNREHVIQVGVMIDEDKIVDTMTKSLSRTLEKEIESQVRDMFKRSCYGGTLSASSEYVIKTWLDDHKDEVIKITSEQLVEKLYRTKAVKEMVKKVGDEL